MTDEPRPEGPRDYEPPAAEDLEADETIVTQAGAPVTYPVR